MSFECDIIDLTYKYMEREDCEVKRAWYQWYM